MNEPFNIPESLADEWDHLSYEEFLALKEGDRVNVWIPADDTVREGTFKSAHVAASILPFTEGEPANGFYLGSEEPPVQHSAHWQHFLKPKRYRWVTSEEMTPIVKKIISENFESFKRLTEDEKYRG